MADYEDYLAALADVTGSAGATRAAAGRLDQQYDTEVAAAAAERDAARARHARLRTETGRRIDAARAALARVGRPNLLSGPLDAVPVTRAGEAEVTAAVRAVQAAADRVIALAVPAPAPPPPSSPAGSRWFLVGLGIAVAVLVLLLLFHP
ncbi:hypothetical protein Lfu02_73420 [Longispora fulva]|uniref:Uncharacterized protein n=1 Tax=Longispora fulva TaxID=619741 RepID=A0A8J7GDX0_9ACTN|nr:hypothetical protein [Longispora fulva]MBG6133928.1 hypothetical protein [Longispora fulva]GIG62970.1 hypothetical protein Lfu02_73420 [Longispora fulva]